MCRVQSYRQSELGSRGNTARKVVRKYKRMTLRKEMRRLRRLVLEDTSECVPVSSGQLLDMTVSLIEELEARLVTQLRSGQVPEVIRRRGAGVEWGKVEVDTLRDLMGDIMAEM